MERGASYTVHRAGVSVVGLQVLFVVADGALVDQTVLCPGEVRGSISSREVERKSASLSRDDPFRVAFWVEHRRERVSRGWLPSFRGGQIFRLFKHYQDNTNDERGSP